MQTLTPEESGPIVYVRACLEGLKPKALIRIAADSDVSPRTLMNIQKGRDAHYSTVMKVHDQLKKNEAEAAPAGKVKK